MKILYIAPYNLHSDILSSLRKSDPFYDVKIITKEEIISQLYGRVDKKYITDLMIKYGVTYQAAKEYLSYLPKINATNTPHLSYLFDLKKDVELKNNKYLNQFFKDSKVKIIGYSKFDKELIFALKDIGVEFEFKDDFDKCEREVVVFNNIEDEVYGVLNEVAKLIDEGVDINNIFIYTRNENHLYFIEKFSKSFGFAVNLPSEETYFDLESSKIVMEKLRQGMDLQTIYDELKDKYDLSLLEKYLSENFKNLPSNIQIDFLFNEFKSTKIQSAKYNNAVNVIDHFLVDKDAHVFMMGFNQGSIPSSYKDNNFITDKEKEIVGLNTSIDKLLIDEDLLTQFIFSKNNIKISRSRKSRTETYFPSYLILKHGIKTINYNFPEYIYSRDMVEYYSGKYKDLFNFYKESSPEYFGFKNLAKTPYFSYNNTFTGVNVVKENQLLKHSYTSVKKYNECPFKYYLSNFLKLDPFETTFQMKLGNVAHHIFENQFNDNFDFDEEWNIAIRKDEFDNKETVLLANLKKQIKKASDASILHYKKHIAIGGTKEYRNELKIEIPLGKNSYIKGTADKVFIVNNEYVFVIDYKTGNESFSPNELQFGESMQLPTYALLLKHSTEYSDYKIAGLYINNVLEKEFKEEKDEDDLIAKHLKLKGVTLKDNRIVNLIDNTITTSTSSFLNNVGLKKDQSFRASNSLINEEEFENYQQIATEFYKNNDLEIRKNNFEIKPKFFSKNKYACKYCSYKDICYVKESQRQYMSEEAKEEAEDGMVD